MANDRIIVINELEMMRNKDGHGEFQSYCPTRIENKHKIS
jgi:hypothetical protein